MADKLISELDAAVALAGTDELPASQSGTTRKVSIELLAAAIGVPIGAILMWSGAIADIPSGWAFCDGTANAPGPDLRDKFVVGAKQDDAGVAKSNIEGSLQVSGGATGHSHSAHAALTHTGGAVGDHTGLTHGLTIADHPDLTHAALSHPALTITHADHAVASVSHSHASGVDVSIPAQTIASGVDISLPSGSFASHAAISVPSGSIASHANISVPSGSFASNAAISVPSQAIASRADLSRPTGSHSHAASTVSMTMGSINTGVLTTPTAATRGTLSATTQTLPIATHSGTQASGADVSMPALNVAAVTGSGPSGSIASVANASAPTASVASVANASAPTGSVAQATGSRPSLPVAAVTGSRPTLSGSHAATTLTHADHSFPSLSHQDIGSHRGTDYGVHTFTAPAAHGTAGTLVHAFTQPDVHSISAHDTVSQVPSYFALAYIQKMAA